MKPHQDPYGATSSRNAKPPVLSNTGGQLKEEPVPDRWGPFKGDMGSPFPHWRIISTIYGVVGQVLTNILLRIFQSPTFIDLDQNGESCTIPPPPVDADRELRRQLDSLTWTDKRHGIQPNR